MPPMGSYPVGSTPPDKPDEPDYLPDENDKAAWWRYECLTHAGFSADIALQLADTVDWRKAISLRDKGASEEQIVHILL